MTTELAEKLLEFECCSLHENYSGRGMFGETTTAITVENLQTLLSAILSDGIEGTGQVERLRFDNLGRDIIIY